MNRANYEALTRRRRRQRERRAAARPEKVCPLSRACRPGLYGSTLRPDQITAFAECVEALGGEFLFYHYPGRSRCVFFLSTVNPCGGPPCATDHEAGGRQLLFDLIVPPTMSPPPVVAFKSKGWVLPGWHYEARDE